MAHGHHGSHGHGGGGGFSHGRDGGGQFGHRYGGGGVGRDSGGSFPIHHGPSHRPFLHHPHHHIFPARTPMIVPIVTPGPMYTSSLRDFGVSLLSWVCLIFPWVAIAFVTLVTFNSIRQEYGHRSEVWTLKSSSTMPIDVSSLFTREIQVKNLMASKGPVLYTFSEKPALSRSADYSVNFNSSLGPNSYWQWAFWLNKGSELKISYSVPSSGLILAIPSGRNGLEEWKDNPKDPGTAEFWTWLTGTGETSFVVPSDDMYYIGLGNLYSYTSKALVDVKIHSLLYETTKADTVCEVFQRVCSANTPFLGSTYIVLETPSQGTVLDWEVEVIQIGRWALLWVIIGIIVGCVAAVCMYRAWQGVRDENDRFVEVAFPAQVNTAPDAAAPPRSAAPSAPLADSSVLGEGSEREPLIKNKNDKQGVEEEETGLPEGDLCAVCFENPKDSFIDPCGHRSTCYNCGVSIQKGTSPRCPICREQIRAVRRIYDV